VVEGVIVTVGVVVFVGMRVGVGIAIAVAVSEEVGIEVFTLTVVIATTLGEGTQAALSMRNNSNKSVRFIITFHLLQQAA
jgi:hypothetical protein